MAPGVRSSGPCSVSGCARDARVNGMCKGHAEKARRDSLPYVACSEEGCDKDRRYGAAGRCAMHAKRFRLYGDASVTLRVAGGREMQPCAAEGCDRLECESFPPYCAMHGARVRRHGDPHVTNTPARNHAERLITERSLHCVPYQGRVTARGYGNYRSVWIRVRGPIPNGAHLDHRCRVTDCVNPDHLEPVTPTENVRRRTIARRYEKLHGPQGGDFWLSFDWTA